MTDNEPYQRIQDVNDVQHDIRQMEDNLRRLKGQLRQLEWGLLGGMAVYDPEKCIRLCEGTARSMETIAEKIEELPDTPEEAIEDAE